MARLETKKPPLPQLTSRTQSALAAADTGLLWNHSQQGVLLVVEDREDEALLLQRAFAKANLLNPLQMVSSGEEAITYLKGEGKYADRQVYPLPTLLLLDLKMPGTDGFEVLQWIRQKPELSGLRVVVLTASEHIRDLSRAYQLGANSFLVKPLSFTGFVQMTESLEGAWIWLSQEPKRLAEAE